MTFEEFQAGRVETDDVRTAERHGDPDSEGRDAGYIYPTGLYISKVGESWPEEARAEGAFYLIIGNEEWIANDLAKLERILYDAFRNDGLEEAAAA